MQTLEHTTESAAAHVDFGRVARMMREEPESAASASLLERFEARHGELEEAYYGVHLDVAVALTVSRGEDGRGDVVHVLCGPGVLLDEAAEQLLFECCALHRLGDLTLARGQDRGICMRMLFGIVSTLFRSLDRVAGDPTRARPAGLESGFLGCQLRQVRDFYDRASQRQAQLRYFAGMTGGLAAVVLLAALVLAGLSRVPGAELTTARLGLCLTAGAFGAMVSVMYGITSGSLRLDALVLGGESGTRVLAVAGVMRPVLGAVFGLVLYVLVNSGLLPLDVPADPSREVFFYLAVAFLAGFSERWARGLVAGTEERMGAAQSA